MLPRHTAVSPAMTPERGAGDHVPAVILERARDGLGSGIRALDDQNRGPTVEDEPRTKGPAPITAARGDATRRLPLRARFPDPYIRISTGSARRTILRKEDLHEC